jgi:hypothetical protein
MQMLSQFDQAVADQAGAAARRREEAAGGARQAAPAPQELRPAGKTAADPGEAGGRHTLSLTTAYGDLLAAEEVSDADLAAALHRFHQQAILRANAVIVMDGVSHTRNSFLEFVREFNDWAARQRNPAHA